MSQIPMPALRSLDTLSEQGSVPKTQKPVSVPTLKQETSLLKEALREMGPSDSSITGLVFMVGAGNVESHNQHDARTSRHNDQ